MESTVFLTAQPPTGRRPFFGGLNLFSPQNKRFTILAMAVTFITIVTMASVVYLATHGSSTTITTLVGFAGPVVIVQLIAMMRQEQSTEEARQRQQQSADEAREHRLLIEAEIKKTRHDIKGDLQANSLKMDEVVKKTNGGLTTAVREAGEQARLGERDQIWNDPELCDGFAEKVAEKIVEKQRTAEAERHIPRPPYPPGTP